MAPQQHSHHHHNNNNATPTNSNVNGNANGRGHHHHRAVQPTSSSYSYDETTNDEQNQQQPSMTEIMYTVDHLATFTVGETYGLLYPTDGLRRLRQMERTSGIWTQRMYLRIETLTVVMIDFDSNETVERFPLQLVHDPAAFLSDDPAELYNNILVFTVVSEAVSGRSPTEMHLFHCLRASADRVADELRYAIRRAREKLGLYKPPAPSTTGASALPAQQQHTVTSYYSNGDRQKRQPPPPPPPMPPDTSTNRRSHNNSHHHHKRITTTSTVIQEEETDDAQQQQQQPNGKPKTLGVSVKQTVKELNNVIAARRYSKPVAASSNTAVSPTVHINGNGRHHHHHHNHHPNGNGHHGQVSSRANNGNARSNNRPSRADETTPDSSDHSGHSDWMRKFARRRPATITEQHTPHAATATTTATNSLLSEDDYEREVHVLNRCFDDIESFVARLQIAYASRDELERRRRFGKQQQDAANKNNKKKKDKDHGSAINGGVSTPAAGSIVSEQILLQRAQLPPERDFVDILQKFKLSFNLLAKLKGQIHDPNSPELVHFLFTPLAMIVDAVQHASLLLPPHEWPAPPDLAQRVLSPLLKRDTVHLLQNCLTSKEFDLWKSLGEAWSIPQESWRGPLVPPYRPVFYSGWEPYGSSSDDWRHNQTTNGGAAAATSPPPLERIQLPPLGVDPYQWLLARESERINRNIQPAPPPIEEVDEETSEERAARLALAEVEKRQRHWVDELETIGARMVHVVYPRAGANEKELSAQRGEVLQVLDATRNWWKLKNWRGDIGFAPHTILAPYPPGRS